MGCILNKNALEVRNERTFGTLISLLKSKVEIEDIVKWTEIDLYNNKLKLDKHIELMIWNAIKECENLRDLCEASKGMDAKKCGLIQISPSQLSKVNKARDYRVFVWIFCELIHSTRKYHVC